MTMAAACDAERRLRTMPSTPAASTEICVVIFYAVLCFHHGEYSAIFTMVTIGSPIYNILATL